MRSLCLQITVFPHIVAAATILFWSCKTSKFSNTFLIYFSIFNENLNSFLTRVRKLFKGGNYKRKYFQKPFHNQSVITKVWFKMECLSARWFTINEIWLNFIKLFTCRIVQLFQAENKSLYKKETKSNLLRSKPL